MTNEKNETNTMSIDFRKKSSKTDGTYWPSLDIYDPKMTKEKWKDALSDSLLTNENTLLMLRYMLKEGGESTCANLEKKYGKDAQHYNSLGTHWGEKVKKKYNCPDCIDKTQDGEKNRLFVIPFVGRYVENEKGRTRYSWKLRDELKEALEEMDLDKNYKKDGTDVKLNTILYGPPGTGKTYHTVNYAVAIIENKKLAEVKSESYDAVFSRYKSYKKEGRIAFVTFHQSYGYEEFIEGIKPTTALDGEADEGDIRYAVVPGTFKSFCEKAQRVVTVDNEKIIGLNKDPSVWKVSLERTGDNSTRSECLMNGHIRIGWDEYGKDVTDEIDYTKSGGKKPLNAFVNRMQIGDIVLSCYSESTIDAIGVVSGEYEWHEEYAKLKRVRKVNWLVKNIRENILDINDGRAMTLSTVYRMTNVAVNDVLKIVEKYGATDEKSKEEKKNHVFIIDEINRGNISKIFGELITLLEPSKRIGEREETEVILPYSAKPFGVPDNVYVIGTMNTADRSIATVDTALRRRFDFEEMPPDPNVLKGVEVEGVSVSDLLERINKRICVLYDREHMIGHSYFIGLKEDSSVENLASIFKNNIIPLLQEYFYDDYEKIRLVLGDNGKEDESAQFIVAKQNDYAELFNNADVGLDDGFEYEINEKAFENIEAYRLI